MRTEPIQERQEARFEHRRRRPRAAALALVVGVLAAIPLRPSGGERAITGPAPGEAAQREIRVVQMPRDRARRRRGGDKRALHTPEGVLVDQGFEVAPDLT